jgi:hypothetical protein
MIRVIAAALAAVVAATSAGAEVSAAIKCEAGMQEEAGSFLACSSRAYKKLTLTGETDKFGASLRKCEEDLAAAWTRLEAATERAGDACPTLADAGEIDHFLGQCLSAVVATVGGNVLLVEDPLTCSDQLDSCEADLATADARLSTCADWLEAIGSGEVVGYAPSLPAEQIFAYGGLYGQAARVDAKMVLKAFTVNTAGGVNARFALYNSSSGGEPYALLASTPVTALAGGIEEILIESGAIALVPGTYWVMAEYEYTTAVAIDSRGPIPTASRAKNFSDPLPFLFGDVTGNQVPPMQVALKML